MLYKALGFTVWKATRLYLRRRFGRSSGGSGRRKALMLGALGLAAAGTAVAVTRRSGASA